MADEEEAVADEGCADDDSVTTALAWAKKKRKLCSVNNNNNNNNNNQGCTYSSAHKFTVQQWMKCAGVCQEPRISLTFYTQTLITSNQFPGVDSSLQ